MVKFITDFFQNHNYSLVEYGIFFVAITIFFKVIDDFFINKIYMRQNFFVSIPSSVKMKENIDYKSDFKLIFLLVPIVVFSTFLYAFFYLPIDSNSYIQSNYGILYIYLLISFGSFISVLGAWAVPSIFSFLGSIRMIYQTIAALLLLFCISSIVMLYGETADLYLIEKSQQGGWFCFIHFPVFFVYFFVVSMLKGQAPFNLPKSERSLATGVYSQHSGLSYQISCFNETMLLVLLTFYGIFLFLGGSSPIYLLEDWPIWISFLIKIIFMLFVLNGMKFSLPNIKSEDVIKISYIYILPFLVLWELIIAFVKVL